MKVKVKPILDRVLVKELKIESIVVVDEGNTKRGEVVAVGKGKYDLMGNPIPLSVEVGDIIIFQYGNELDVEKEHYWFVTESDIIGVLQ